jgi:hypothetical protein
VQSLCLSIASLLPLLSPMSSVSLNPILVQCLVS